MGDVGSSFAAVVFDGVFTRDDRCERPLVRLDVFVDHEPPGIVVELDYDQRGGAVIDLGLRSPTTHCGWSGAARSRVLVADAVATPGYLPTSMAAGSWQVLLGLHRIPEPGIPYRLTVRAATQAEVAAERSAVPIAPDVPERGPRRHLPSPNGLTWVAADLHSHTVHSDGALTVPQLAALAVERRLDVLAVTDHNTISHHRELPAAAARYGITLVPGQEITTDFGHANAWGDIGFVDFTAPADLWPQIVAQRGGLLSINHPVAADCSWRQRLPASIRVAEVWHSSWEIFRSWGAPMAWWLAADPDLIPVGGSDYHRHGADGLPGTPTTWVACADPGGSDVLDGITAGRTAVSRGPVGPVLLRIDDELVAVDAEGLALTSPRRQRFTVHAPWQGWGGSMFAADAGPWWLEGPGLEIFALTR